MTIQEIVNNTQTPNTVRTILKDLESLGIDVGDTLIVHSSLSSIGWVNAGQASLVDALLLALGEEGTLVMPAHTPDNSDPATWKFPPIPTDWHTIVKQTMPPFDIETTPCDSTGKVADYFRTYPGTLRSDHPRVSFCANGTNAEEIVETHDLTPMFGMDSPMGACYNLGAKVLLIGVDYESCSAFHLAEFFAKTPKKITEGCSIYGLDGPLWQEFEDYDYDTDGFNDIGESLEALGEVTIGNIGNATCKVFKMQNAVDFATKWLEDNRDIK
jgi:aminoglycoside 3-N-acetyltransferase